MSSTGGWHSTLLQQYARTPSLSHAVIQSLAHLLNRMTIVSQFLITTCCCIRSRLNPTQPRLLTCSLIQSKQARRWSVWTAWKCLKRESFGAFWASLCLYMETHSAFYMSLFLSLFLSPNFCQETHSGSSCSPWWHRELLRVGTPPVQRLRCVRHSGAGFPRNKDRSLDISGC